MENKNQPASPATIHKVKGEEVETVSFPGLSKREHFAGLAMQSLAGLERQSSESHSKDVASRVAIQALFFADELLKQLEK